MEDIYAKYNLKNLKIILTRCDDLLKTREEMKVEMTGAPNNIVQHGDTVMEPKEENKYQELIDRLGFQDKRLRIVLRRFDDV